MEILDNGTIIDQPPSAYHLTGDAVALAKFFTCKKTDTVIDIGCGTGVLTLLIADRAKIVFAVEINETAAKQAGANVGLNKLSNVRVLCADIKTAHRIKTDGGSLLANTADAIICNPPYFDTGTLPNNKNKRLARHNTTLTLDELALSATRLLKCGGNIFFCYPAGKTAKAVTIFENRNFRVKELKFISNEKGVYLTLFKCKKYADDGGHGTKITF